MAVYILPVRADRTYRGAYPNRIHSCGYVRDSEDCDGNQYMSIELNSGVRMSVSTDRITTSRHMPRPGLEITAILKPGTVIGTMPRPVYDDWLARVRAEHAAYRNAISE